MLVALAAVASLVLPAAAAAKPILAVGDQKATMFSDPRFGWLHITHSRIVVSWRVEQTTWERDLVAQWMAGARRARVRPLVAFGHVWGGKQRKTLPSVKAFTKTVRDFRKRYPWVRDYTPWNEANHCSQPTCNHPARAAAYYNVMRAQCRKCTVVAADVLDQRNMVPWLRTFRRYAKGSPRVWGLHNYLDANRLRTSGTKHMLTAVKGQIWMTETGGIVRRTHLQEADRRVRGVARSRRGRDELDPAAGEPLLADQARLPVPVERELGDAGVGLGPGRGVRREPSRLRCPRPGDGPRPRAGTGRPARHARAAALQRATAANRLQPAAVAVERSAAPAGQRITATATAAAAAVTLSRAATATAATGAAVPAARLPTPELGVLPTVLVNG